jgi:hypothetical protein
MILVTTKEVGGKDYFFYSSVYKFSSCIKAIKVTTKQGKELLRTIFQEWSSYFKGDLRKIGVIDGGVTITRGDVRTGWTRPVVSEIGLCSGLDTTFNPTPVDKPDPLGPKVDLRQLCVDAEIHLNLESTDQAYYQYQVGKTRPKSESGHYRFTYNPQVGIIPKEI